MDLRVGEWVMAEFSMLPSPIKVTATVKRPQEPLVDIAVNCSLEATEDAEPSDLLVDPNSSLLEGYLQQHSKTQTQPQRPFIRRTKRDGYRPRELPVLRDQSPVISVLLARDKERVRHHRFASLIHNPLSTGLARIRGLQSPLHTPAAFLSNENRSRYYEKRSSSVMNGSPLPHLLQLQGQSVSPGRGKPVLKTLNLQRMRLNAYLCGCN